MTWGDWDVQIGNAKSADMLFGSEGSLGILVQENEYQQQGGQTGPGLGYWKPYADGMTENGDAAAGTAEWGIGFKRSTGGVAGIQAGSTVSGYVWIEWDSDEVFSFTGDCSWAADTSAPSSNERIDLPDLDPIADKDLLPDALEVFAIILCPILFLFIATTCYCRVQRSKRKAREQADRASRFQGNGTEF